MAAGIKSLKTVEHIYRDQIKSKNGEFVEKKLIRGVVFIVTKSYGLIC